MSTHPESPNPPTPPAEGAPTSWDGVSSVIGETLEDPGATLSTPRASEAPPAHGDGTAAPAVAESPVLPVETALVDTAVEKTVGPANNTTPSSSGDSKAPVGDAEVAAPSVEARPADAVATARHQPGELKLVIEQGMSVGKEFLISEPDMLVGRRDPEQQSTPDIDLFDQEVPSNRYISRRQARLYFKDGQLLVEDLDSSNGTSLNGHLIAPHEPRVLALQDKVHFGQSVLMRLKLV